MLSFNPITGQLDLVNPAVESGGSSLIPDPQSPGGETMIKVGSNSYVSGSTNIGSTDFVFELPEIDPSVPIIGGSQQRSYLATTLNPNGISDAIISRGVIADQLFNSTVYQNVTGLSFSLKGGTNYSFRADIIYSSSVSTESPGFGVYYNPLLTVSGKVLIEFQTNSLGASLVSYRDLNSPYMHTVGIATPARVTITGVIIPTSDCIIDIKAASETGGANSISVLAGSIAYISPLR